RALHQLREAGGLGRLEPVADRPGLARAVAQTVLELRLAGLRPDEVAPRSSELARVLAAFEAHLDTQKLADRAAILELAMAAAGPSPPALLLLDVPIWT